ncbi:MAG TPA: HD domain-containing protein [Chloroflexota bacterium]|nr:HD domain-containing protein [Chloroflexota bacterium]
MTDMTTPDQRPPDPPPAVRHTAPTVEDAIILAASAHRGQVYPSQHREPYILHPLRVMVGLGADAPDAARIVALLHDLVEDTSISLAELRRLGYPDPILAAVDRLTRREGESYDAYIERVAGDPLATRVKLADLADNLANKHQMETAAARERIARYRRAQARLRGAASPSPAP